MRRYPVAGFRPATADLFEVLFCLQENDLAEALGVSVDLVRLWRDGKSPVPKIAYNLCRTLCGYLPASFGRFASAKVVEDRLVLQDRVWKESLSFDEVVNMPYFRRCALLTKVQADTIERLKVERDFYKSQCRREAKFGMTLNQIFP